MADRFGNGDTANDSGGYGPDRLVSGLDPTHNGFYHGGDLRGIIDRLDYIEGLGTTAIWLTPSFKNRPVQGAGDGVSAGYHGYRDAGQCSARQGGGMARAGRAAKARAVP